MIYRWFASLAFSWLWAIIMCLWTIKVGVSENQAIVVMMTTVGCGTCVSFALLVFNYKK